MISKKELDALYKKYAKDLIAILIGELKKVKKEATGRLIKSLKLDLQGLAQQTNIFINAEPYLVNVDKGRKKGTYPPIAPLKKWARLKGMDEGAAYAIQKKIYKFGIKPTNVIDKAIKKHERQKLKDLEKQLAAKVEKSIIDNFNK